MVVVNVGGHSIRGSNERRARDGGNLCPLWLVILRSICYNVGDTVQPQYSWLSQDFR